MNRSGVKRKSTAVLRVRGSGVWVVDALGGYVLASFPTALGAVQGAVEAQRAAQEGDAGLAVDRRLELRIGVDVGAVRREGNRASGEG